MNLLPGLLFRMRPNTNFMEARLTASIKPGKASYIKICQYSVKDKKGQNTLDKKGQNKETVRKPSLILEKISRPRWVLALFFQINQNSKVLQSADYHAKLKKNIVIVSQQSDHRIRRTKIVV